MMTRFIGWITMAVALCLLPPPTRGQSPQVTSTAPLLESLREKHDLPALAVIVVREGEICDRAAVGVRKFGDPTPVTTNDVFHIGSCTKAMTATLAATLIEEGTLRWATTIADVFPELKDTMDRQYQDVTVEQLLTHRGGVPGKPPAGAWNRAWQEKGTPLEQRREFIRAVLANPPAATPGTQMIYSNQGYAIVGAMLEKLTGRSWETLITKRLLVPLQMPSAGFGPPGTKGETGQPWGHRRKEGTVEPLQSDNPPAIAPGGGVHCTLDDLARFVMMHLQGENAGGILQPETFRKLHTPPEGGDYACGWAVVNRSWAGGHALTHSGSNTMWYLVMWLAPEKHFAVIAATNIAGPGAEQACDQAAAAMIGKWLGR